MSRDKDKDHKKKEAKRPKGHKNSASDVRDANGAGSAAALPLTRPEPPRSKAIVQEAEQDAELSEADSESDQIEDDEGDLVTPEIDRGIDSVLAALRSNSQSLKDAKVRFFPDVGAEGTAEAREPAQQERPVYLKDYQRETLLSGAALDDEDDNHSNTALGGQPQPASYAHQQEADRAALLKEINAQGGDASDDEDGLLQKRTTAREIPAVELALPDPETDADGFLNAYLSNKAWVPPPKSEKKPSYTDVVGANVGPEDDDEEEDDDEFDDLSEKFESAYNFRFEDPASAEIVSYARDQSTLRRGKMGSRQKKRERERAEREKEKEQQKLELAKLRKAKVGEVSNRLAQLQEAVGEDDSALAQRLSAEDLDGDWDNDEWDRRMQKLFDDEYYGRDGGKLDAGEFRDDEPLEQEPHSEREDDSARADGGDGDDAEPTAPRKLSRKELKRKAEQFVEENQDLLVEETLKPRQSFRYREVDPESFGLTSRDILLASDKELNQFVGLKKLASYREQERIAKDRKRYAKRKRLREWRKGVFGLEDEPTDELWEQRKRAAESEAGAPPPPKHKSKKRKQH